MTVTILGYIIIPLGLLLLLDRKDKLLFAMIVFSGFTGSSIINIGELGIQPSYYLAALWLLQSLFQNDFKIRKSQSRELRYLYIFLGVCIVSLIMPFILSGEVLIMNTASIIEYLDFSSSNITQTIYLIFCVVIFREIAIVIERNPEKKKFIYNSYIVGIIFVLGVTVYQIVAYKFSLPFDVIFKTIIKNKMSDELFWDTRISGPCREASMLAYYLATALPLCVRNEHLLVKWGGCFVIFLCGIMSYSSTFLVGSFAWIILENFYRLYQSYLGHKIKIQKKTALFLFLLIPIVIVYAFWGETESISMSLSKVIDAFNTKLSLQNVSGIERSETFDLLMAAFAESPLLGVGFGSTRGKDLFSTWMANIGLIGMLSFIWFLASVLKKTRKDAKFFISIILMWFCMFISVPEPYNLFIWIIMAMAIETSSVIKNH